MDRLDIIAAAERRRGWFVNLASDKHGWQCRLECGDSILPPTHARPRGMAPTALEAVEAAIASRNRLMRELGLAVA